MRKWAQVCEDIGCRYVCSTGVGTDGEVNTGIGLDAYHIVFGYKQWEHERVNGTGTCMW